MSTLINSERVKKLSDIVAKRYPYSYRADTFDRHEKNMNKIDELQRVTVLATQLTEMEKTVLYTKWIRQLAGKIFQSSNRQSWYSSIDGTYRTDEELYEYFLNLYDNGLINKETGALIKGELVP